MMLVVVSGEEFPAVRPGGLDGGGRGADRTGSLRLGLVLFRWLQSGAAQTGNRVADTGSFWTMAEHAGDRGPDGCSGC
jgi:hypothetical protein